MENFKSWLQKEAFFGMFGNKDQNHQQEFFAKDIFWSTSDCRLVLTIIVDNPNIIANKTQVQFQLPGFLWLPGIWESSKQTMAWITAAIAPCDMSNKTISKLNDWWAKMGGSKWNADLMNPGNLITRKGSTVKILVKWNPPVAQATQNI